MSKVDKTSNLKIQASYYLLAGFGVLNLAPIDFPLRHTHEEVRYTEDGIKIRSVFKIDMIRSRCM